jgi:hypothetical protein
MSNIRQAIGLVRPAGGDDRYPELGFLHPILIDDEVWALAEHPDNPSLAALVRRAAEAVDYFAWEMESADFTALVHGSRGPMPLTLRVSWCEAAQCVHIAPTAQALWSSRTARAYHPRY